MHPRQAFVKHEKVVLVQKPSADPASASGTPIPDDVRADSSAQDTPGTGRRTPAKSLSSRWQKGGGGVKARSSVPGHGRLLFEERAGGTMISASVLRELAARFQTQTVLALQVHFRGVAFQRDRKNFTRNNVHVCVGGFLIRVRNWLFLMACKT